MNRFLLIVASITPLWTSADPITCGALRTAYRSTECCGRPDDSTAQCTPTEPSDDISEGVVNGARSALQQMVDGGSIKGAWAAVGNAHSGATRSIAVGEQAPGVAATSDSVLRIASLTKMIIGLVIAKLIDQRVIDLDSRVGDYVDFMNAQLRYAASPTNASVGGTYNMGDLTVRDLLLMKSGLPYCFFGYGFFGFLSSIGVFPLTAAEAQYINACVAHTSASKKGPDVFAFVFGGDASDSEWANGEHTPLKEVFVADLILPDRPGTRMNYGYDYDILSMIASVAIERAFGTTFITWFDTHFTAPMGLEDRIFIANANMPNVPSSVSTKLAELSIVRDAGGLQFMAGADAGCAYPANTAKWASECPNDVSSWTNTPFDAASLSKGTVPVDYLDWGGGLAFMSLPDLGRFLRVMAGEGLYGKQRIITADVLRLMRRTTADPMVPTPISISSYALYGTGANTGHAWAAIGGAAALDWPGASWSYPYVPGCTYEWIGYWGLRAIYNTCSGWYATTAIQQDAQLPRDDKVGNYALELMANVANGNASLSSHTTIRTGSSLSTAGRQRRPLV